MADSAAIPLVGRSIELDRVRAALERAAAAAGNTLLLAGEEGIGKSRLAAEALALARQRGFLTLNGTAYALHTDLAYAPMLEAIGPFLAGLAAGRLGQLVRGLPDLGQLFSNLPLGTPAPLGDPALERTRFFEAVARLVERIAAERPLVILIDDLHWADHASLDLVHYVARGLADQRVLLLGTYRLDEARAHPRLRSLIRSLQRSGLAEEMTLAPLRPDAVARLAASLLQGQPPEALLSFLQDRAAGTPLYVTALIRGLRESGGLFRAGGAWTVGSGSLSEVPPVVRDLVLGRLERLDASERMSVELMAVAGDAASRAVLAQVSGIPPEELDAAIGRLGQMGLLVVEHPGSEVLYRVAHPLIAEVAYAELPESRRRRLHIEVAAALEAVGIENPQRLAHHYRGAAWEADSDRALMVFIAAAAAGEMVHADAEAADHLAAALELARIHRPSLVNELLERIGLARMRAGQLDLAVAAWLEAVGQRQRADDGPAVIRLRGLLAQAEWERGRFEEAEAQLAAGFAVGAVGEAGEAELAELHHIRLQFLSRMSDPGGMTDVLAALPRVGGTRQMQATAELAQAYSAFLHGRFSDARVEGLHALAMAEDAQLITLAVRAHRHLGMTAANTGDVQLARDHIVADLALVGRAGSPTLEVGVRGFQLLVDLMTDAWDEVLAGASSLLALSNRIGSARGVAMALAPQAIVLAFRGQVEEAARTLAEARRVYGSAEAIDRHAFITVEVGDAIVALANGEPQRARTLADAAAARPAVLPCTTFTVLGEAQVAANDPAAALETATRIRELGPKAPLPVACASWIEGLAWAALGEQQALVCFRDAADRLDQLGQPYQAARARLCWAEIAFAGQTTDGDRPWETADIVDAARGSMTTFDRLGARPLQDRTRRLLRALGERPAPRRAASGDLSDRELQVVRLVARGLSNAEIAEHLFISPRTVTTHLQHIYRRLGLSSRTALIRWVMDRGLIAENT